MKRSLQVSAPLLAATALALSSGCRKPEMQRCVDEQNRVVADSLCQNPAAQQPAHAPTGGYFPIYRYYYGGSGGYDLGTPVSGGTYTALSGHTYASSTTRGGFGSTHDGSSADSSGAHGSSSGGE